MSMPQTRALTSQEITDFLSRNGTVATQVEEFNLLDLFSTYEQSPGTDDFLTWLQSVYINSPIPAYGITVNDSVLGSVVVFPDASGVLHFTQVIGASPTSQSTQPVGAGGQAPIIPPALLTGSGLASIGIGLAIVYMLINRRN